MKFIIALALIALPILAFSGDGVRESPVEKGLVQVHGKNLRACGFKPGEESARQEDNMVQFDVRCIDIPLAWVSKNYKDCTFTMISTGTSANVALQCGEEGTF